MSANRTIGGFGRWGGRTRQIHCLRDLGFGVLSNFLGFTRLGRDLLDGPLGRGLEIRFLLPISLAPATHNESQATGRRKVQ